VVGIFYKIHYDFPHPALVESWPRSARLNEPSDQARPDEPVEAEAFRETFEHISKFPFAGTRRELARLRL
jgi:hypothetical protein